MEEDVTADGVARGPPPPPLLGRGVCIATTANKGYAMGTFGGIRASSFGQPTLSDHVKSYSDACESRMKFLENTVTSHRRYIGELEDSIKELKQAVRQLLPRHHHGLQYGHPYKMTRHDSWYCDVCKKTYGDFVGSYHCAQCQYDRCADCEFKSRLLPHRPVCSFD